MNYFWIVIALVVLLYIFFRMFRGGNRYGAVRNAFLGGILGTHHLYSNRAVNSEISDVQIYTIMLVPI